MANPIPFKPLNAKQAQDIAKAMCRNDAKRLQDVLERIGGVDESAFQTLLDPSDSIHSMLGQEKTSPGLFVRTLARAPDEVFDWLIGSLADSQSLCWSRALDFGAGRDPRVTRGIFEAHARYDLDIDLEMVRWIDVFRDSDRVAQGGRQSSQWDANRAQVDQLCEKFLQKFGADRLAEMRSSLSQRPGACLSPIAALDKAMAAIERETLGSSTDSPGSKAAELPKPSRKRAL